MIDDNPADGETVRRLLEAEAIPWPVDFELCLEPRQAPEVLENRGADVIIIDYHFPFGTGFDLLKKLRGNGIDTPAVMLTGQGSEDVAGRAVKAGLDDYIPKDELSSRTLAESLERLLGTGETDPPRPRGISQSSGEARLQSLPRLFFRLNQSLKDNRTPTLYFLQIELSNTQEYSSLDWPGLFIGSTTRSLPQEAPLCQLNETTVAVFAGDLPGETIEVDEISTKFVEMAGQAGEDQFSDVGGPAEDFKISGVVINYEPDFVDPARLLNRGLDQIENRPSGNQLVRVQLDTAGPGSFNHE